MKLLFFQIVFLSFFWAFTAIAGTAELKNALLFYDDCDDRKNPDKNVRLRTGLPPEPGKFGNALRIRRRMVNLAANGDFEKPLSDNWILSGNAKLLENKGVKNGRGIMLRDGASAALPLPKLRPGGLYSISFSACAVPGKENDAKVSLELSSGTQTVKPLEKVSVSDSGFARFQAAVKSADDCGTLRLRAAKGAIIIDKISIIAGDNREDSFTPPLKMLSRDGIFVPVEYIDVKSGSFSCWIKAPWLRTGFENTYPAGILEVAAERPENVRKNIPHNALGIICWFSRKKNVPRKKMHLVAKGKSGSYAETSIDLNKLTSDTEKWYHFVFNWWRKGRKMHLQIYVDGKLRISAERPFNGQDRSPKRMIIGFCGGAYLNGLIDECAIFKRPLTAEEVKSLSESNSPLSIINKEN